MLLLLVTLSGVIITWDRCEVPKKNCPSDLGRESFDPVGDENNGARRHW
jgi:hypothetical protein